MTSVKRFFIKERCHCSPLYSFQWLISAILFSQSATAITTGEGRNLRLTENDLLYIYHCSYIGLVVLGRNQPFLNSSCLELVSGYWQILLFFLPVLFQSSYTFKVICVLRKSIYESACGPLHDSFFTCTGHLWTWLKVTVIIRIYDKNNVAFSRTLNLRDSQGFAFSEILILHRYTCDATMLQTKDLCDALVIIWIF